MNSTPLRWALYVCRRNFIKYANFRNTHPAICTNCTYGCECLQLRKSAEELYRTPAAPGRIAAETVIFFLRVTILAQSFKVKRVNGK